MAARKRRQSMTLLFVVACVVTVAPSHASGMDDTWRLGLRGGVWVYDLEPRPFTDPQVRTVQANGLIGFSAIWLDDVELGWEAGIESGLWLKQIHDPMADYTPSSPTSVVLSLPIFGRIQYDFGRLVARTQLGIAFALPFTGEGRVFELFVGYLGAGLDVEWESAALTFDVYYQAGPFIGAVNDGIESKLVGYLFLTGVSW